MEGSRGTDENEKVEPESSKNSENNSQDADDEAQSLRSVADNMQENRTTDITEGSSSIPSILDENSMKICRPISVKIIRLPDAVVNKCTASAEVKRKKRKSIYMWKNGFNEKHKRRKYLRKKKLQDIRKAALLQRLQQVGVDEKDINGVEKSRPDEILDGETSTRSESVTREESPNEKSDLPAESTTMEENEDHKSEEFTKVCETTSEERVASETLESELTITTESHEMPQNKSDEINCPEISDEIEVRSATKIREDSTNAATEISSISSPPVSPERNNNQNRKICFRRLPEGQSSINIQPEETRKRLFQSDDGEIEAPQKKPKSSDSMESSEGKDSAEGRNASESIESAAPIAKEATPIELSRCDPKFVRRRTTSIKRNILMEVRVVLWRLEDLHDPLVMRWNIKTHLERLNDVTMTARRTSPMKSPLTSEEKSELGTVVAGVPITSLEDPLEALEATKRLDIPQDTPTDSISKEHIFAPLEEENTVPIAREEAENIEEDEDDEEIVKFLRTKRKVRPSIYSSSSESSSSCQELLSTRSLRSKTPVINSPRLEEMSDYQEAVKNSLLHNHVSMDSTDSSSSEDFCNRKEIPKTSPRRREEARRASLLHKRGTSESTTSSTSDSTFSHEEIRRPPSTRRKAFRVVMENSSVESPLHGNKDSSSFFSEEEASNSSSHECYSRGEESNLDDNEAEVTDGCANGSASRTSNFVTCGHNREDDASLEALAEVNCDFSALDPERSNDRDEVLMARRKLTALKNAMVVLTRLEDLEGLSEGNRYPVNEIEFRAAEDFEFSRNLSSTPDPLEINRDDNQNSLRDTENPIAPFFTSVTRSSPRKTLRKAAISGVQESDLDTVGLDDACSHVTTESDVELTLGLDDACSQETTESDVEMTLVLEENSFQDTPESDAESLVSQNANRTLLASRDYTESPDIVFLDVGKTGVSQNDGIINSTQRPSIVSVRSLAEGTLTDANSSSGDSRNATAHDDNNLDEHRKSRPRAEHESDKRRHTRKNSPAKHKCVTRQSVLKSSKLLKEPKTSSTSRNLGFLCKICKTNFVSPIQLTNHRIICNKKGLQKKASIDESPNEDETADSENPPNAIVEKSSTKANKKKKQTQKNTVPKKVRTRNRSRIDNLICGVCSIIFATTQALSEHIFKHNTEELQEAYRIAKTKALVDSQASNAASEREKEKTASDQLANKNASVEANQDKSLPQDSSAEDAQPIATSARVANNNSLAMKSATVCSCHRDKHPARPDKTDLQIEMVLLCRHCMVLFRRRECFEIHYRTNPQCANDRARGRWPRLYCANCQSTLNSWAGMRRHLEVHASLNIEGTVRFVCNICRVVFVGFGALFYNHWSSHLKDSMFVASRYSFPKNSVQPIDDIPKLPIGASPDESYILVAEHVCSSCKKPFSTRRDLEIHEKSKSCKETDEIAGSEKEGETKWYCDVCDLRFTARRALNQHSKARHGQRYLCVATSPNYQAFMCTRCFGMKRLVKEIEDHWRDQPQHDLPLSFIETMTSAQRPRIMNEEHNDPKNSNQVPQNPSLDTFVTHTRSINSSETSKTNDDSVVIDITDDNQPEIDCVFQDIAKTPEKRATCVDNEDRTNLASTTSSSPAKKSNNSSMLRNLLGRSPISMKNLDNEQRTKKRALEDPLVDIVLSEASNANVSAKLVVGERKKDAVNRTDDQQDMDSYNIILTDKPSPGNMKMVHGRIDSAGPPVKVAMRTTVSAAKANDEESTANRSAATIVSTSESSQVPPEVDPPIKSTVIRNLCVTRPDIANGKENRKLAKTSGPKEADLSLPAVLQSQPALPEIIDIADENEEDEVRPTVSVERASKPTRVIDKKTTKMDVSNKSGVFKLKKAVASMSIHKQTCPATIVNRPSKVNFFNASGTSKHPQAYEFVLDTAEMSFEEIRLEDLMRSKQLATGDSAGTKKSGFLRVKNLSELQAVKKHTCTTCNAAFESYASLEEHQQVHVCAPLEKDPQYPKGMTAALVLPENPKTTSTQPLPTVYATGSVVTQQLIGVDSGLGVISSVPVSSVIVNNEPAGSWINVGSQNDPLSTVALVNTTHSLTGGTLLMNLGGQQSTNNNGSAIMTTSIATSSTTIAQTQEILAVQQQQPSMLGINQQLNDNCSGQLGYHVMPAMVVPQTARIDRQQCNESVLRNTSTANLPINGQIHNAPFTYHSDRPNRYLCNICTTFRCNSIGTMNSHVMKHYTGFHNSILSQTQSKEGTSRDAMVRGNGTESNSSNSLVRDSWFMKSTPRGLVWVTSLGATSQQPGSSAGQDNNQSVGTTLSYHGNPGAYTPGGQIVYRCLICKSAMYRTYPPLRNHVVLVHGITDFISAGLDNIVQKIFLCTYCAQGTVMYDTEEGLRQHLDACHPNTCPNCRRGFVNYLGLKAHLGHCNASLRDTQNASDNNC